MLRQTILLLSVLGLTGCLELGGGGGGDDESSSGSKPPTAITPDQPPGDTPGQTPNDPSEEAPDSPGAPDTPGTSPGTPGTPPETPTPVDPYAEPLGGAREPLDALGFYDTRADGQTRPVRNDLSGNLPAMLQLVQSHSVDPQGNEQNNMPRLTSEREALLLFTPDPALGELNQVSVEVSLDGQVKGTLAMRHPDDLYRADRDSDDDRPDVVYSRRAWSVVLPWDSVKPGLALRFVDDQGRQGTRAAEGFDFAAPAQLVVQSIRLGMLTDPPQRSGHWFLTQPAQAATDYFQTVPVARLIASQYEDVRLSRVMVASGVIYDTASSVAGDVYSGDMRENTAKSTFSTGINLANIGVTSAGMASQQNPHLTQAAVIHHAQGVYSNGVQWHGLSGGNGILTLEDSVGNEFSHEIGHHYGLGHYPGQDGDNYFLSAHHYDSGWGYIAHRKRMRSNLYWDRGTDPILNGMATYAGTYSFDRDAMSGGSPSSSLSSYTHYTGYSTKNAIQPAVDKAVVASDSPTGYRKWNAQSRSMEVFDAKVPSSTQVWYNRADGRYLAPRRTGVQVFTLLGGYDPEAKVALLYPPLRGNWGHVFDLPEPQDNAATRQCWLSVDFAAGATRRIAVAPSRMGSNANKLHVNFAQDELPLAARLVCREQSGAAEQELASITFPQGLAPLPAPVIVGQERGFSALRDVELPRLEAALEAVADRRVPSLGASDRLLYDSYADQPAGLSATAQAVLQRMRELEAKGLRLNRWLDAYKAQLETDPKAGEALAALLRTLDLDGSPLLPAAQTFKLKNGNCVRVEQVDGKPNPYVSAAKECTGGIDEQWLVDASGRIRSAADPGQCLTHRSSIALTACDARKDAQVWDFSELPLLKNGGKCLNLSGGYLTDGRGKLIPYRCTGGAANEAWYGLSLNDGPLLPLVQNRNLSSIIGFAGRQGSVAEL